MTTAAAVSLYFFLLLYRCDYCGSRIVVTTAAAISLCFFLLPYCYGYCCCRVVVLSPIAVLLLLLLQDCFGFGGCCIFLVSMAAVLLWFPQLPYCCDYCVTVVMIYAAAVSLRLFLQHTHVISPTGVLL